MSQPAKIVTACIVVIGNEILSGRTRDANIAYLAAELGALGVRVMECRIIADVEATIVATINEVRRKFDYVFTTGGIGPTHDDITADSIAKAFGVGISEHPEAVARMTRHYGDPALFTPARRRMARVPHGGTLVDNPVSVAPGFQMENVFTFRASSPSRWAPCRSVTTISTSAAIPPSATASPASRWCCAARMMHGWRRPRSS